MDLKKVFIGVILMLIVVGSVSIVFKVFKMNNTQSESEKIEHQAEKKDYVFGFFEPREVADKPYHEYLTYMNNIYYKKITNYDEYLECKEMWDGILDMSKDDFNSKFMFVTIIENYSMLDLSLGEMHSDDDTLYVGLKKVSDEITNAGISIIADKKLDREKVEVFRTVDDRKDLSSYSDIRKLPYEYTIGQAIEDKCLTVLGVGRAYNIDIYNDFISKVKNKEDAEIRIVTEILHGDIGIEIVDIAYLKETEKFIVCIDKTREKEKWTYNYYEYTDIETNENEEILGFSLVNNVLDEDDINKRLAMDFFK